MKRSATFSALVSLAALSVCARAAEKAKVLQVLDGDTCLLEDGRKVRYLGIDAPEKGDPQSEEATQANNHLVGGKEVSLEFARPRQDRDGRLLAFVFIGGRFVNEELVRQGHAHLRRPLPARHKDTLLKAQDEARMAGRGIWAKSTKWNLAITAVHAKPVGGKENLNDEYIIIQNQGNEPVNLTGWTLSDETNRRYLFPNYTLPAGARVTLRTGLGRNSDAELFWGSRTAVWNDDGDTILIREPGGSLILSHIYFY